MSVYNSQSNDDKLGQLQQKVEFILGNIELAKQSLNDDSKLESNRDHLNDSYIIDLRVSDLKKENFQLQKAIQQCQSTLETIMAKFREQQENHYHQITKLKQQLHDQTQEHTKIVDELGQENVFLKEQFKSAVDVIRQAVENCTSVNNCTVTETVSQIMVENESLRKLLQISNV